MALPQHAVRGPLYVALRRDEVIATTPSLALISVGVASLVLFKTFNALSEIIHSAANAAEGLVTDRTHFLRYSLRS